MFDYPSYFLRHPGAFAGIDERYSRIVLARAQDFSEHQRLADDGCPNGETPMLPSWYDHAYTSVVPFTVENAGLLMELRDTKTPWNPDRLAFFGTALSAKEIPSAVAVRQLYVESGIELSRTSLIPLRFYIETETPVPVLRIVFGALLDRVPQAFGRGSSSVAIVRAWEVPQYKIITRLARQDIAAFLEDPNGVESGTI